VEHSSCEIIETSLLMMFLLSIKEVNDCCRVDAFGSGDAVGSPMSAPAAGGGLGKQAPALQHMPVRCQADVLLGASANVCQTTDRRTTGSFACNACKACKTAACTAGMGFVRCHSMLHARAQIASRMSLGTGEAAASKRDAWQNWQWSMNYELNLQVATLGQCSC
jgi:hypothetical protein